MVATWRIVGGVDVGGIIVRTAQELSSPLADGRLATASQVEQIDLIKDRLHYRLIAGGGPAEGWVSVKVGEKVLAECIDIDQRKTGQSGTGFDAVGTDALQGAHAEPPGKSGTSFETVDVAALRGAHQEQTGPSASGRDTVASGNRHPFMGIRKNDQRFATLRSSKFAEKQEGGQHSRPEISRKFAAHNASFFRGKSESQTSPISSEPVWAGWSIVETPTTCFIPQEKTETGDVSYPLPTDDDDDADVQNLKDDIAGLMQRCRDYGIPMYKLESVDGAARIVQQYQRLEKSPASTIKNEYKLRGFAPKRAMTKEELLASMKNVLVWERLQVEELRRICTIQAPDVDVVSGMDRADLLRTLADATWKARDVPVRRLPSRLVGLGVLDQIDALETKSVADLQAQCTKLGAPLEDKPEREHLLSRLRHAIVWKVMEVPELRVDCLSRGVPPDTIPDEIVDHKQPAWKPGHSSNKKPAMEKALLQSLWLDIWAAFGISVKRVGSHAAAAKLFHETEKTRALDVDGLKKLYEEWEMPREPGLDRRFLVERLCGVLVWRTVTLPELQREYEESRVPPMEELVFNGEDESKMRHTLMKNLLLCSCLPAWENLGIPVRKLASLQEIIEVVDMWAVYEVSSIEELKRACWQRGIPTDGILEKRELVSVLRQVLLWGALPLRELQKEVMDPDLAASSDMEDRAWLVEQLLLDKFADTFQARGIPARRLGSLKAASSLASERAALQSMDPQRLRESADKLGLPSTIMPREQILAIMSDVALWQLLPLEELNELCRKCSVSQQPATRSEGEQRSFQIDMLLTSACASTYEAQGVPVQRLGSLKQATLVLELWGKLEALSVADLLFKASAFGLHAHEGIERAELLKRLRLALLWKELPFEELQRECRNHKVNSIARPEERRALALRLAAALWEPKAPPPPKPKTMPPSKQAQFTSPPRQAQPKPPWSGQRKPQGPPTRPVVQSPKVKTSFVVLELAPTAPFTEVKKAYRRLALKYHPDKNIDGAAEQSSQAFLAVGEAYAHLCDHFQQKRG